MSLAICTFFFFNDTATTEIYTLSLHDALPISVLSSGFAGRYAASAAALIASSDRSVPVSAAPAWTDRKSTRLNSSHGYISYAVFCLKKKKTTDIFRGKQRIRLLCYRCVLEPSC